MPIREVNVQFADKNTGEILEGTPMLIPFKKKIKEPWLIAKLEGLMNLALDKDLGQQDLRIAFYYLASTGFENEILVTQAEVATALEMKKQHVSTSVKKLVAKQILLEGEKSGRCKTYFLNPDYGWRGKIGDKYFAASANAANSAYENLADGKDRQQMLKSHEIQRLHKDPMFQPDNDALVEQANELLPIIEHPDKIHA